MSVRKRVWRNGSGSGSAWIAAYTDAEGKRHIRSFETKPEAQAFHARVSLPSRRRRQGRRETVEDELALLRDELAALAAKIELLLARIERK